MQMSLLVEFNRNIMSHLNMMCINWDLSLCINSRQDHIKYNYWMKNLHNIQFEHYNLSCLNISRNFNQSLEDSKFGCNKKCNNWGQIKYMKNILSNINHKLRFVGQDKNLQGMWIDIDLLIINSCQVYMSNSFELNSYKFHNFLDMANISKLSYHHTSQHHIRFNFKHTHFNCSNSYWHYKQYMISFQLKYIERMQYHKHYKYMIEHCCKILQDNLACIVILKDFTKW